MRFRTRLELQGRRRRPRGLRHVETDGFAALGRCHDGECQTVRRHGIAIGATDAVFTAADSIDEIAVLAPDRVAVGAAGRPSSPGVDHDVAVGQFDGEPVGKDVQADTVVPAEQARRGDVGDHAALEGQTCRCHRRHVEARKFGPVGVSDAAVDL